MYLTIVILIFFDFSSSVSTAATRSRVKRQGDFGVNFGGNALCRVPFIANADIIVDQHPNATPGQLLDSIVLRVTCKRGHVLMGRGVPVCLFGKWLDELPQCLNAVDRCGRLIPQFEPMSIGGRTANRSEIPWHAGIYKKGRNSSSESITYEQICGGSIVKDNIVISAAHCFTTDRGKKKSIKKYAVAVGKFYREWDNINDLPDDVQKFNVSEVFIPEQYHGFMTHFQADLAIVKLSSEIQFKPHIMPVCLDFNFDLDYIQLSSGNIGKVAGWGYKNEEGESSSTLQVLEEPIYNSSQCFDTIPIESKNLITLDKVCAGFTDGSKALCKGDSGGGLAIPDYIYKNIPIYFLRGIVSTTTSSNKQCNRHSLTYFTRIRQHKELINEVLWSKS